MYDNFSRVPVDSVDAGDICAITGLSDVSIGETVCDKANPQPLPTITVPALALSPLPSSGCASQGMVVRVAADGGAGGARAGGGGPFQELAAWGMLMMDILSKCR